MLQRTFFLSLLALLPCLAASAQQLPGTLPGTVAPGSTPYKIISPLTQPTITPGALHLLELEIKFAQAVAEGGGKAFASFFADDAVTLSNGQPAVLGRGAIAASANWSPKDYSLSWTPQGAQMGPSNDMGFTWGHYVAKSMGLDGKPVVTTGRYITVWKKQPNGQWKVAMDAGADEPAAMECCTVKQP